MAYQGNSYLSTGQKNFAGMPKPNAQPVKADGTMAQDLWRYLNAQTTAPNVESGVNVGPSPATFQATSNGTMLVKGGTVSAISITRNASYNIGITSGFIPLSIGDILTVTYSVLPTMTWFPR